MEIRNGLNFKGNVPAEQPKARWFIQHIVRRNIWQSIENKDKY